MQRFTSTIQTVPKSSLVVSQRSCTPNFGPQFRSQIRTPQNFNFLCLCSTQNQYFSAVFHFLAVFRPNGLARPPQTLTFQYRTPRSRLVIPSPRDFSAENLILTQLFGEFQGSVFPVPKISLDIRTFKMLKVLTSMGIFGIGKTAPWNSPKSWVKNVFSAEQSRGEGITRPERGVRY